MISAHISIIPEFAEKIDVLNAAEHFEVNKTEIINKQTDSQIIFRGIKTSQGTQTANLKSIAGVTTWICDEAEELPDENTFDKIDLSIRSQKQRNRIIIILNPTHKEHWIYRRFFESRAIPEGFNGIVEDTTYIHTSYLDNIKNLSQSFIDYCEKLKINNPFRYQHLIMGGWLHDVEGALWNYNQLQQCRVSELPQMRRIVVSVDPAVTATSESDETGIIVCGIDYNDTCYVIDDLSGRYTPAQWGKRAVYAYHKYNADRIVAEENQGGDLVQQNIKIVDNTVSYRGVHAARGKYTRAEPVAALYEDHKVKHYMGHVKLENQMTTWVPGDDSPDRVDALVWGITELALKKKGGGFA